MKKIIFSALILLIFIGIVAFKRLQHYADVFATLGVSKEEATEWISENMISGALYMVLTDQMKNLSKEKRGEVVKSLGDYIKTYVQSPEFAEKYRAKREEELALAFGDQSGPSKEEMLQNFIETMQNNEKMQLEVIKTASGKSKVEMEMYLKEIRRILSILKDPKHPSFNKVFSEMKEEQYPSLQNMKIDDPEEAKAAAEEQKKYRKEMEEAYPPTAKQMVAKRLKEFIDLAETVDFNAKLEKRGNKYYFVDAKYEMKDPDWKKLFRCGKETIIPARAYAQQWLASLK